VEKLMFEFDFFIEHCLRGYFRAYESDGDFGGSVRVFCHIGEPLQAGTLRAGHRDFHAATSY
jgi:hypothetical protein